MTRFEENQYDDNEGVASKITRLETQMIFVLKAIDAPREIKQISSIAEPKTFLGFSEEKAMRWLVIAALGLAAGGNLQGIVGTLAKAVQP